MKTYLSKVLTDKRAVAALPERAQGGEGSFALRGGRLAAQGRGSLTHGFFGHFLEFAIFCNAGGVFLVVFGIFSAFFGVCNAGRFLG